MDVTLRQWVDEAERVVVFTGAGMSTESGIPDFRSPGGVWTRMHRLCFRIFLPAKKCELRHGGAKLLLMPRLAEPTQ